ncbi:hypothetical protein [Pseudomonas viridiflava]|uniref:Uncharacterized protein n=1 Tax=Pseudomonas viridiflava TaxID=33069 RepID=A0A3M5PLF2_PSEVI|nr:hypothetical protein [Pseudomonas viridiflava]RMT85440.1 hypothetical protein ALP40_01217 [Pseudomonas viridiflava]
MTFDVIPYSDSNLIRCFVSGSRNLNTFEGVESKLHLDYFSEYFGELEARTILAEHDYVDRDYLEDYAAYYDRCFQEYSRRTQRLHFFSREFTAEDFERCLIGEPGALSEAELQASYLGFVVVKPLPQSFVGRTCLVTYPDDGGRRYFPSLRTYDVHLFGINLEVRSLAYQEQDHVVAACATSAIWSCLQGTGKLFQHIIPPPVEITRWASELMPADVTRSGSRAFPNYGLTASQMAHAIKRVGLDPMVVGTPNRYVLNGVVYAFLRGKIPCVMICQLKDHSGEGEPRSDGFHAIAMTGYSLREGEPIGAVEAGGLQLRATRIDKLYGHDDQVGPFARMTWPALSSADQLGNSKELLTSWRGDVRAEMEFVMLPIYHKIRVPYAEIHDLVMAADRYLEAVRDQFDVDRGEWDIYLTTASDYKSSVRDQYPGLGFDLRDSLYRSLPRFLWRASVAVDGEMQADFLFDATGIATHDLLVHMVMKEGAYADMFRTVAVLSAEGSLRPKQHVKTILDRIYAAPQPV